MRSTMRCSSTTRRDSSRSRGSRTDARFTSSRKPSNASALEVRCRFGLLDAEYNGRMRTEPAELLRDALSLPAEARAALIDSLIESLDIEIDPDAEEAWREEIHRRLQQIDSGTAKMIPWDDARSKLRDSLRR